MCKVFKNKDLACNAAGLERSDPRIQLAPTGTNLAFPVHTTSRVLHAIADRLLVNVQSDVIHIASEEPPRLFSESACPLSSASCNTSRSSSTKHSNNTVRTQHSA